MAILVSFHLNTKEERMRNVPWMVVLYVDGGVLQRLILNEIANMAVDYMIMIGVFVNL